MKQLLLSLALLAAGCLGAAAHPAYLTGADARIDPDGSLHLTMQFDTLAFVLNDTSARIGNEPMEALLNGPRADLETRLAGAKARFLHGLVVATDLGAATTAAVEFPDVQAVLAWRDARRPVLPVVLPVNVKGALPPRATSVTFRFPAVFDQVVLTVERPGEEPSAEPLAAGAVSTALPVRLDPPPGSPGK